LIKADDEAIAAPKFDVATLDEIRHLLGGFDVVGTVQRLDRDQLTVEPDVIGDIFWHPNPAGSSALTEVVLFQSFACEPQGELTRLRSDAQLTEMANNKAGRVCRSGAGQTRLGPHSRLRWSLPPMSLFESVSSREAQARGHWQPVSDQAARTVLRNLPTWLFKRSLSPASDCAADSTWPDAELVSLDP
jgi:hypothetical protein